MINKIPSILEIALFVLPRSTFIKKRIRMVDTISIPISKFKAVSKAIGLINALTPSTSRMLNKLDPIAFPTARSEFFFNAAKIDVTSSGNEVAAAIIVRPTIDWDNPKSAVIWSAPLTIH